MLKKCFLILFVVLSCFFQNNQSFICVGLIEHREAEIRDLIKKYEYCQSHKPTEEEIAEVRQNNESQLEVLARDIYCKNFEDLESSIFTRFDSLSENIDSFGKEATSDQEKDLKMIAELVRRREVLRGNIKKLFPHYTDPETRAKEREKERAEAFSAILKSSFECTLPEIGHPKEESVDKNSTSYAYDDALFWLVASSY